MTTTAEAVERYLQTDLVLHEALARGFLNVRRAARWLIESQEWEATEEAVVSAIRRYDPDPSLDLESVLHILPAVRVSGRSGLAIVKLPRARENVVNLTEALRSLDPKETHGVHPERKVLTLIVEDSRVEEVLEKVGKEAVEDISRNITRLDLGFPDDGIVSATGIAVIVNILGHQGVRVLGLFGALPSCSILVSHDDAPTARRALDNLVKREHLLLPS